MRHLLNPMRARHRIKRPSWLLFDVLLFAAGRDRKTGEEIGFFENLKRAYMTGQYHYQVASDKVADLARKMIPEPTPEADPESRLADDKAWAQFEKDHDADIAAGREPEGPNYPGPGEFTKVVDEPIRDPSRLLTDDDHIIFVERKPARLTRGEILDAEHTLESPARAAERSKAREDANLPARPGEAAARGAQRARELAKDRKSLPPPSRDAGREL